MKPYFGPFAIAVLAFAGLAGNAKAQAVDQLQINVPYEFVVAGKTLPAGTYRVSRISTVDIQELVLTNRDGSTGVFVLSSEVEAARGYKPSFTFQDINGQRFLTKIQTAEHVFAVDVTKSEIMEASAKSHANPAASGVSGTD